MAAAIVQTGRKVRFALPYPCYTTWALGKTVQVKFLMIDTISLDMNDPGKRKTRPDSTEFSLFFCNLGFSATEFIQQAIGKAMINGNKVKFAFCRRVAH